MRYTEARETEKFGDVRLSVQASAWHYCLPRVSTLPLEDYSHVEIAVITMANELCLPSAVGVEGFDQHFEPGKSPVAGNVLQEVVEELRKALRQRQGEIDLEPLEGEALKAEVIRLFV